MLREFKKKIIKLSDLELMLELEVAVISVGYGNLESYSKTRMRSIYRKREICRKELEKRLAKRNP